MSLERREQILKLLAKGGLVKIPTLTSTLGVSMATIRRDLDALEEQGLLKKVYGGAISAFPRGIEPSTKMRETTNLNLKVEIANKIFDIVEEGDTLVLDNGTTTAEIAKCLVHKNNLTIVTNSIKVGILTVENPSIKVYLVGGYLRPDEMALSGTISCEVLKQFSVDKAIISSAGLSSSGFLTEVHIEEASLRRLMMNIAKLKILAVDHTKFRKEMLIKVCSISDFDVVVTDNSISEDDRLWIKKRGPEVI